MSLPVKTKNCKVKMSRPVKTSLKKELENRTNNRNGNDKEDMKREAVKTEDIFISVQTGLIEGSEVDADFRIANVIVNEEKDDRNYEATDIDALKTAKAEASDAGRVDITKSEADTAEVEGKTSNIYLEKCIDDGITIKVEDEHFYDEITKTVLLPSDITMPKRKREHPREDNASNSTMGNDLVKKRQVLRRRKNDKTKDRDKEFFDDGSGKNDFEDDWRPPNVGKDAEEERDSDTEFRGRRRTKFSRTPKVTPTSKAASTSRQGRDIKGAVNGSDCEEDEIMFDPDDMNDGRQINPDLNSVPPDAQTLLTESNTSLNSVPPDAQTLLTESNTSQCERSSSSGSSSSGSSSSGSSSGSSSSGSSSSRLDETENKEDGFCSDDSVRDKDYIPDEAERDSSDEEQDDTTKWIYAGLSKGLKPNGKEKQYEQKDSATGNNGIQEGNEEVMGENVELTAIEGRVTSNNVEMSTSELDSPQKSKKRKLKQSEWKRNINKKRRNMGLTYESAGKNRKQKEARKIKPACKESCRMKCTSKISHDQRQHIFSSYWNLGDIGLQREYIAKCTKEITPTYRCIRQNRKRGPRGNNIWYSFPVDTTLTRVCKTFFLNTLDINDRVTRTALAKQKKVAGLVSEGDNRGKHQNHPTLDPQIKAGVRAHIESIPKMESHYTRKRTTREYICGSRSLADIHRDYVEECKEKKKPYANYAMFYNIFVNEYNIAFFTPKKDQCDECVLFNNAEGEAKEKLKEKHDTHQSEKILSREEKKQDKTEGNAIVAVYDLQAVLQLPQGDVSTLYYKSKLNVINFTIYDIKTNDCDCFLWDETNGNRGVNEIGTCILSYIKKLCDKNQGEDNIELIFYSDNCAGQQKNKFMLALYMYAVTNLPVESITHKFLVKGHTQNEGDSAHSLIERQIKRLRKGGPIFVPETLVTAIRSAKKNGQPFHVRVMQYDDFKNVKSLTTQMGAINVKDLKLSEIKIMKFEKQCPTSFSVKYSYSDEFKHFQLIKKPKVVTDLLQCYSEKISLSENKKKDLKELCEKGVIPRPYSEFFNQIT